MYEILTNMTSSVMRRVVRTGGSCLLLDKRIVVLGGMFHPVTLLFLLFASAAFEWPTKGGTVSSL